MTLAEFGGITPLVSLGAASVVVLLAIALDRNHRAAFELTLLGLAGNFVAACVLALHPPGQITPLFIIDGYAVFYLCLITAGSFAVTLLAYDYLVPRVKKPEEFYILLLLATLGSAVLVCSCHFASFFLGLELLSVSLYGLISYRWTHVAAIEAAIKYLVLAAASASFLLFGMALVYAELGTMELGEFAHRYASGSGITAMLLAGTTMILVGIGFKLALVPFHLWTPDVYQGAAAPVTAYIATVSKGAMFALLVRYFMRLEPLNHAALSLVFSVLAIASMFTGNLLALRSRSIKRILAYSSIAHMGYLLVAFLAAGSLGPAAAAFYLSAYFVTTIGAFGVVSVLSPEQDDADALEDYRGIAWRRPWLAGVLAAMLLSLAGIPLTAGFIAKFYVLTAGTASSLWNLVILLVINSTIGLYYYLRVVILLYSRPEAAPLPESHSEVPDLDAAVQAAPFAPVPSLWGCVVLGVSTGMLFWLGIFPGPLIRVIQTLVTGSL